MDKTLYERPSELLQKLIRFDTTNPPGHERACIQFLRELLDANGVQASIFAKEPERPNLVARLQGRGEGSPLLLQGHVDVVTTANQTWQNPPFSGDLIDGYIWGRGALDMKSGVAMMVSAFLQLHASPDPPPQDVILLVLSDEEAGGDFGARFLVEEHPDLFAGVKYAIGEFGGFSFYVGGQLFYPIMVSEKQTCQISLHIEGQGGHGSLPMRGQAMGQLGQLLTALDRKRLPVHIDPVVHQMISQIAEHLPFPQNQVLRQLLRPRLTDRVLDAMGALGHTFNALLHNTVAPTIIEASDKINVIPSQVVVKADGRLLPTFTPDHLMIELQRILPRGIHMSIDLFDAGPAQPDMTHYNTLATLLRQADPAGVPVPLMLNGVTDGRFFSRLGIQTYGFLPMKLPPEFNFSQTIHAADERIPAEAVTFGRDILIQAIPRLA